MSCLVSNLDFDQTRSTQNSAPQYIVYFHTALIHSPAVCCYRHTSFLYAYQQKQCVPTTYLENDPGPVQVGYNTLTVCIAERSTASSCSAQEGSFLQAGNEFTHSNFRLWASEAVGPYCANKLVHKPFCIALNSSGAHINHQTSPYCSNAVCSPCGQQLQGQYLHGGESWTLDRHFWCNLSLACFTSQSFIIPSPMSGYECVWFDLTRKHPSWSEVTEVAHYSSLVPQQRIYSNNLGSLFVLKSDNHQHSTVTWHKCTDSTYFDWRFLHQSLDVRQTVYLMHLVVQAWHAQSLPFESGCAYALICDQRASLPQWLTMCLYTIKVETSISPGVAIKVLASFFETTCLNQESSVTARCSDFEDCSAMGNFLVMCGWALTSWVLAVCIYNTHYPSPLQVAVSMHASACTLARGNFLKWLGVELTFWIVAVFPQTGYIQPRIAI